MRPTNSGLTTSQETGVLAGGTLAIGRRYPNSTTKRDARAGHALLGADGSIQDVITTVQKCQWWTKSLNRNEISPDGGLPQH